MVDENLEKQFPFRIFLEQNQQKRERERRNFTIEFESPNGVCYLLETIFPFEYLEQKRTRKKQKQKL